MSKKPVATKVQETSKKAPEAPKAKGFDAKSYVKGGVSEEEVQAAKAAFDLFDSDQGGTVDIKGNSSFM
jgi:Ca2+-binding EF-hand superfamily protein